VTRKVGGPFAAMGSIPSTRPIWTWWALKASIPRGRPNTHSRETKERDGCQCTTLNRPESRDGMSRVLIRNLLDPSLWIPATGHYWSVKTSSPTANESSNTCSTKWSPTAAVMNRYFMGSLQQRWIEYTECTVRHGRINRAIRHLTIT
jgi:hypothetical protein